MRIGENLSQSFGYAKEGFFGKWGRWIVLIISSIIFPLIFGYTLRVMRGITPAPEPSEYGSMFIDGIKMWIIEIIYMIIPVILAFVIFLLSGGLSVGTLIVMGVANPAAIGSMLLGTLGLSFAVLLIFAIIFSLFMTIGLIRFARSGKMGDAFAFSQIASIIGKIGWIKYIVAVIVLIIVLGIIYFILSIIPFIGWLLALIFMPFLAVVGARYYTMIYESVQS